MVRAPTWEDLAYLLIGLLSSASLVGAAWAWWDRHRRDPWQRLRARIDRRLARLGVSVLVHEAPRSLALRVRAQFGDAGEALARQLEAFDAMRYGRAASVLPERGWWAGFVAAGKALKEPLATAALR